MIRNVKTHLICGFLGAGKTSAIAHLLSQRPADERWAVLVNEFGEIGLDKALLTSAQDSSDNIEIQQVAGGCMCCAAGVPMVIALNKLLAAVKPHRLFIEPTGLGHPRQVLAALLKPEYQGVLDVQGVTTLVDARVLSQPRYRDHELFRQQIEIADLVLASKADLYLAQEYAELETFLTQLTFSKPYQLRPLHHAQLSLAWLPHGNRALVKSAPQPLPKFNVAKPAVKQMSHDMLKLSSSALTQSPRQNDFFSMGWQFESTVRFDQKRLLALFAELDVVRIKGVMNTELGAIRINQIGKEIDIADIAPQARSQVEFIFSHQLSDQQSMADFVSNVLTKCFAY